MSVDGQTVQNSGTTNYPNVAFSPLANPVSINSGAQFNTFGTGSFLFGGAVSGAQLIGSDLVGSPGFLNMGTFQAGGSNLTVNVPFNNGGTATFFGANNIFQFPNGGTQT